MSTSGTIERFQRSASSEARMSAEEKLVEEIRDIQRRIARGNLLTTKLRAIKLHFILHNEPIGKIDYQLHDLDTTQRLHLENLERMRGALEKIRDRTLSPERMADRREKRRKPTGCYGLSASQSSGRRPD